MKSLVTANIVVVARNLNPSIFSQLWLVEEDIIKKPDFGENCVFTPIGVHVTTPSFILDVFPERLQVTLIGKSKDDVSMVAEKVVSIIRKLPHTPYTAIGANFHWNVASDTEADFAQLTRRLFVKPDIPLYGEFSQEDARFGGYMTKYIFGLRLKLDIKPIQEKRGQEEVEVLRFNFNYNLDLEHGKHISQMEDFLRKWQTMKDKSEEIVSRLQVRIDEGIDNDN